MDELLELRLLARRREMMISCMFNSYDEVRLFR
jgi:hypothetical protein